MTLKETFNNPEQDRALVSAVGNDDILAIKAALEKGADPNVRDATTGRNLLFTIIDKLDTEDGKKKEGSLWAHFFALLQGGTNAGLADKDGVTPLHYGFEKKNAMMICVMLMQPGISANAPDPRTGETPFHRALPLFLEAREDIDKSPLEMLVCVGGDPSIPNRDGLSALDIARASQGENAGQAVAKMLNTPAMKQRRLQDMAKGKSLKIKRA
jgi:ankyrin repeat protein